MDTNFVINSTKGRLVSGRGDNKFSGISIDSRTIKQNQLFVAIKGENFDGHNFICEAINKGAAGVVLEHMCTKPKTKNRFYIKVDSTLDSLGNMAKAWREGFSDLKVIAITGSNGKTTTKEMVSAVMAKRFNVLKNTGNFNNLIGLPLTLFNLNEKNNVAVLELGMNRFGEIRKLCEICRPDIAVITNIGKAHIGNLGGIEGVKKAKGEIVENFSKEQTFIVNIDDKRIVDIAENVDCNKITYSLRGDADIFARDIKRVGMESMVFTLVIKEDSVPVRLGNIGVHNVANALCASACGYAMGIAIDEIADALQQFEFPKMRLELIDSPYGFKIINDSYNANPESMKNALTELSELEGDFKRIAVLADMLELGDDAQKEHEDLGKTAAGLNIDYLFTYGELGGLILKGAEHKVSGASFNDYGAIADEIIKVAGDGDVVLIKGSRGMKMEEIIKIIVGREKN